ncbi:MAG: class I SAM-dependent methyltransferase [Pirellulales bacterium]|nr:class I SAM-dependent methyltransferase [Pirellulales bacterium]
MRIGTAAIAELPGDYELVDVGGGRKRERFGKYVVDRPAMFTDPRGRATHSTGATAGLSSRADFVYQRQSESSSGRWVRGDGSPVAGPVTWNVTIGQLTFELRLTDSGQVGLFPEQADNWQWIDQQVARLAADHYTRNLDPPRVLNLFAYSGASTLSAAAAGAEVAQVDAARPVVQWARRNSELSGLSSAPIRWLVDDARTFVRRELRRRRRYEGIVLDPPSYGHGIKGPRSVLNDWRFQRDLPELLAACRQLLDPERAFMLLTCHTTGVTCEQLAAWFEQATGWRPTQTIDMEIKAATGETLPSGVCVRWTGK